MPAGQRACTNPFIVLANFPLSDLSLYKATYSTSALPFVPDHVVSFMAWFRYPLFVAAVCRVYTLFTPWTLFWGVEMAYFVRSRILESSPTLE